MIGDLTGRLPKDTYKDLLQISNNNQGVDSVLRPVKDGSGEDSALELSTTEVQVRGDLTVLGSINAQLELPLASTEQAGAVKVGAGINVDANGTISISTGGATDAELRDRQTHTGIQGIETIDGLQAALNARAATTHTHDPASEDASGFMSIADKGKLDSIEEFATFNSPDEALRDRATHTGEQSIDTITGLQAAIDGKAPMVHSHATATGSAPGFMSAADKVKLDGLGGGGSYVLPIADEVTLGGVKEGANVTIDASGFISVAAPYSPTIATNSAPGIVQPGNGLTVDETGILNLIDIPLDIPVATADSIGAIKPGANLTIEEDGTLNAAATPYSLPAATGADRGGVRIGTGFTVTNGDTLNVTPYVPPVASSTVAGVVKVGANLQMVDGTLNALLGSGTGSATGVIDVTAPPYNVSAGAGKTQAVRRSNLAALNQALADAVSNGYIVHLPANIIEIEAPTSGTSHVVQASGSTGTTPVMVFGPRCTVVQFTSGQPVWKMTGSGGRLEGVTLTYNAAQTTGDTTYTSATNAALLMDQVAHSVVDSVTLTNSWIGIFTPSSSDSNRNWFQNVKIIRPYHAGVYFVSGYNNRFEGVTVTNDGTTQPCEYGFYLKWCVKTTITNLETSWIRAKVPVGFHGCHNTSINGLGIRSVTPVALNTTEQIAGVVHIDSDATVTARGVRIQDLDITPANSGALKVKLFAHNAGDFLDITDLGVSRILGKNVSTQTVILFGPSAVAASANRGMVARMRQVALDTRAGFQHRVDLLSDFIPDDSDGRKNVGLVEYNSFLGAAEGISNDLPATSTTIYLEKHGSIIQVSAPLTGVVDFTLSNRSDEDYGTLQAPLLSRGATVTIIRHPTATGNFALRLLGHNGTVVNSMTTANQSLVCIFDGTAWRVQSKAMF